MLLTTLSDSARYEALYPGLAAALAYLRRPDLATLPPGRQSVESDQLYAIVEQRPAVGREQAVLEVHRRYIDVQYTVSGAEVMGWRALAECTQPRDAFDEARDVGFFEGAPLVWLPVPPGHLAVFFPEDAHAPLAGSGPLHKVIMKVAVV
jgi:YhcH/YjgK/YiaL family protein